MKLTTSVLAAAALASAASIASAQSAPAPAAQAGTLMPSKAASKAIMELDAAVKANDRANIPAKIAAAQAVATSNNDKYLVASLRLKAAAAANDDAQLLSAADALAASGADQPANVANVYNMVGTQLYQHKQFAQAVTAFSKSVALNPSDSSAMSDLGQAQVAAGQGPAAVATFRKAITAASAAGQKPSEGLYKNAVLTAYNAHLPDSIELGRAWVAAYPSPDNWRNAIAIFRNQTQPDTQGSVDLLRLMQATGALKQPEDYALFIASSAEQLNFAEAQKVYDAGLAAGTIDPTKPQFVEIRNVLKVKAKATPADLEAALKMAPKTANVLHIGDSFYALGDYARAAAIYRDVLAKPDADHDLANLHLGMALARSGDKAGATAALNKVGGARADIAKYWLLFVQQQA